MEQNLPLMLRNRARETPDIIIQYYKDTTGKFRPKTYGQFYEEVVFCTGGLLELGIRRGDRVGIISDNRQEWMVASFGVLAAGAADVPRGGDVTTQELVFILGLTECSLVFTENQKQIRKILDRKAELPCLKTLVTFDPADAGTEAGAAAAGLTILYFASFLALGQKHEAMKPGGAEAEMEKGNAEEIATIIFTSGTTGEPKGVMLSHDNFLCQLSAFDYVFEMKPADIWLSVLPVWHVYERLIEYVIFFNKNGIAYSKPISSALMADFQAIRPQWMVSVPRVWEAVMEAVYRNVKSMGFVTRQLFDFAVSVAMMYTYFRDLTFGLLPNFHGRLRPLDSVLGFFPWLLLLPARGILSLAAFNRLKRGFGGRFRAGISGGGSLPARVDLFFNAVGLRLQEAYGLTETAPMISVRRYKKSRRSTIGQALPNTEVRIINSQGRVLPPGHNGLIFVRGGQVMKGYYQKPEATAAVLSAEGWLNTGDIGMLSHDNELRITGRAKDTIVLRGGENVEPVPIEHKLRESQFIEQCMVSGQDQRYLAALIVPVQNAVMAFAEENSIPIVDYELLLQQPEINEIIANEVADLVSPRTGFSPLSGCLSSGFWQSPLSRAGSFLPRESCSVTVLPRSTRRRFMRCSGRAAAVLLLLLASCEKPPGGAAEFADNAAAAARSAVKAAGGAINSAATAVFGKGGGNPAAGGGSAALPGAADPTLHPDRDDAQLLRITQDARDTLPVFFRHLLRPGKGESNFRVKYPFKADPGSGFGAEQLWLSGINFRDGVYYGVLSNTPYYVASMKRGAVVSFSADEITDWMYTRDGKIIGGLSIKYLLEQIPEHERGGEQRALLEMFE
ncbi:MAG: AMP-binding protein [Treponema sp.]|jgi:long-chain acyl-CoA synthetase|nr:AMP-binding protein [Treponema sp.]